MPVRAQPYAHREEAGRELAGLLTAYRAPPTPVVLGLPRGGVPVARVLARSLYATLDVLVVRKLGLPRHRELAMGAVAGIGDAIELVRNEDVITRAGVTPAAFDAVLRAEVAELHRREAAYRRGRERAAVGGRTVLVVDDGIATGSTIRAACAAVRRQGPARLVIAVPVAAAATVEALGDAADELVCAWTPQPFYAVGQGYRDFGQVGDDDVAELLAADGRP